MNNNNTTYKDSPLGKIPSDWEEKELGEIAEVKGGKRIPKGESLTEENTGFPYIRVSDMFMGGIDSSNILFVPKHIEPSIKNYKIRKEELFITVAGTIGLIGEIPDELDNANLTENANKIIVKHADKKYVLFFLMSDKIQGIIKGTTTNNAQPKLALERIRNIKIALPPLPEQKAIAHILSLMDTAINKNNLLIAKKELQKKWLMQNLLTGKKRLLNDELGIINDKWKTIKLGDVFEFIKSYSISRKGLTKSNKENSIYCIHYGDIHAFYESDFLDFSNQQSIPQIIDESQAINEKDYLIEGDVIMADASEDYEGVGEIVEVVNLNDKIAVGGLHTIVLRGNSEIISNGFRGYFFSSETVRNALRKVATGTSVYSVTKTQIHNLSFIIPNSLKEQIAIAHVLQTAVNEIQLLKTKTEKFREQKKGLMQILLTGKKRLLQ